MKRLKRKLSAEHFFTVLAVIPAAVIFSVGGRQVSAQSRTVIELRAEATVGSEIVTLGDIADISGETAAAARLSSISLGYAPNIGMTREINLRRITLAIAAAGFSADQYGLEAPPLVIVRRAGQEIGQERIRQLAEETILEQFTGTDAEARIIRLDLPEKIDVPVGKVEIRVNFSGVYNIFSTFSLPIDVRVNGRIIRRFSAATEIEARATVFVAGRDLPVNTRISEADVRLEKIRLEKPLVQYIREPSRLRGLVVLRNISKGSVLTTDAVAPAVVIRSGDLLKIVGRSGRMQIVVSGEARSSGRIGDRIAVKNSQSGAIIQAYVVDQGLVRVQF